MWEGRVDSNRTIAHIDNMIRKSNIQPDADFHVVNQMCFCIVNAENISWSLSPWLWKINAVAGGHWLSYEDYDYGKAMDAEFTKSEAMQTKSSRKRQYCQYQLQESHICVKR